MKRRPAVAGTFYPASEGVLRREVEFALVSKEKGRAVGVVSPHAGYVYSGGVAGAVYGAVEVPGSVVILGPNHHGVGSRYAVYASGEWYTPLGAVTIDEDLAQAILDEGSLIKDDCAAHAQEHSLEVQVPFLQVVRPDVRLVPIVIRSDNLPELTAVGEAIARAVRQSGRETLVVASTDMSHTQSSSPTLQARIKKDDLVAIDAICALDADRLFSVVREVGLTMCGYAPTAAAIAAAKALGAARGRLVKYATSWDVTHDYSYVVGYAGVVLE